MRKGRADTEMEMFTKFLQEPVGSQILGLHSQYEPFWRIQSAQKDVNQFVQQMNLPVWDPRVYVAAPELAAEVSTKETEMRARIAGSLVSVKRTVLCQINKK